MRPIFVLVIALVLAAPAGAETLSRAEFKSHAKRLTRALGAFDEPKAIEALTQLAEDDSKRALDKLLLVAKLPSPNVYREATRAIGEMRSDEVHKELTKRLERAKPNRETALLIDSLGTRKDTRAFALLRSVLLQERADPSVLRAALVALDRRLEAVPVLIEFLEVCEGRARPMSQLEALAHVRLTSITGEKFANAAEWRKQWAKLAPRAKLAKRTSKADALWPKPVGSLFGQPLFSRRVVFLLDVSESMREPIDPPSLARRNRPALPRQSGTRLDWARRAVRSSIRSLDSDVRFTVYAFSGFTYIGARPPSRIPANVRGYRWLHQWETKLKPANEANKAKAEQFLAKLKTDPGGTLTLAALRHAHAVKDVDTILLISDGVPTDQDFAGQQLSSDAVLGKHRLLNATRRLTIHTFAPPGSAAATSVPAGRKRGGFGLHDSPKGFLRLLADQTGGWYLSPSLR